MPIIVVDFGKRVIANINGTIYSSPELKQKTLYGQASMTQMTTIKERLLYSGHSDLIF